jgi:hypothetical protein
MQLRIFRKVEDRRYRVSIATEDWSQDQLRLVAKFGDPEVDLGGEFAGPPELEFDSSYRRIYADGPLVRVFDARDYDDDDAAAEAAVVWQDAMVVRISDAYEALLEQADPFTGETVVPVPLS